MRSRLWQQHLHPADQMPTRIEEMSNSTAPPLNNAAEGPAATTAECGVVWFGLVEPDNFFEMTPFFQSLEHVRRGEGTADTADVTSLDIHFFCDGPSAKEGYLCLETPQDAEDLVRKYSGVVMVGCATRFPVRFSLSCKADLMAAQEGYRGQVEEGHANQPPPPPINMADMERDVENLKKEWDEKEAKILLLRGFPYTMSDKDLENYLERVKGNISKVEKGSWDTLNGMEGNGRVFVEVKTARDYMSVLYALNQTFFPQDETQSAQLGEKTRPRYVEVLESSEEERQKKLHSAPDPRKSSNAKKNRRDRGTVGPTPTSATTATATASASASASASTMLRSAVTATAPPPAANAPLSFNAVTSPSPNSAPSRRVSVTTDSFTHNGGFFLATSGPTSSFPAPTQQQVPMQLTSTSPPQPQQQQQQQQFHQLFVNPSQLMPQPQAQPLYAMTSQIIWQPQPAQQQQQQQQPQSMDAVLYRQLQQGFPIYVTNAQDNTVLQFQAVSPPQQLQQQQQQQQQQQYVALPQQNCDYHLEQSGYGNAPFAPNSPLPTTHTNLGNGLFGATMTSSNPFALPERVMTMPQMPRFATVLAQPPPSQQQQQQQQQQHHLQQQQQPFLVRTFNNQGGFTYQLPANYF